MSSKRAKADSQEQSFPAIYQGTCQKLAFTGTSAQSSALSSSTSLVRLISTQNCHVKFGASPTAVADGTGIYLAAGIPEYFGIKGGDKIAAIQDSSGGNLFIAEGAINDI